jgi:hypothetical protein
VFSCRIKKNDILVINYLKGWISSHIYTPNWMGRKMKRYDEMG